MTGHTPSEIDGLRAAAGDGDADAMYELGMHWSGIAAEAQDQVRIWLQASASAGSLDGRVALAAQYVADGKYRDAQWQLQIAETQHPNAAASGFVGIAPNVLGPHLRLGADGETETDLYAVFTVITTRPQYAAAALERIKDTLLDVDERGVVMSLADRIETDIVGLYATPRYVADVESSWLGARILLDTRGAISAAMGRTIVETIVDALVAERVPAVIGGRCAELDAQFVAWSDAAVGC